MNAESTITDEVARHLQLVAAADRDPVHARDRRLADLAQPVVHVLERAEPLPVLARVAEQVLAPGAQVGADAERAAGSGDDDRADVVVPRRVLARARDLAQHPEVEGVQDVRAVQADRRARRRLLVDDRLEPELGRIERARMRRLGHSIDAKFTVNGMPIAIASLPEAANASELDRGLERVHVVPLELGVVPVGRIAERRAEHLARAGTPSTRPVR